METIDKIKEYTWFGGSSMTGGAELYESIAMIINFVIGIGFGFGIISTAYAMVLYITSAGDPNKTQTAWNAFLWGILAALISIAVLTLRKLILTALGVDTAVVNQVIPEGVQN